MANTPDEQFQEQFYHSAPGGDFTQKLLTVIGPAWLGSAAVHALLILILMQIQWQMPVEEDKIVQAQVVEPKKVEEEDKEEPEKPEIDPEIVDNTLPPADQAFIPEVEMEQMDIDVPGFNEEEPDDNPPLAITKLALGDQGAVGHFHGVYGSRGGAGRKKSLIQFGGSKRSEQAVQDGLGWLARAQEKDGHWDAQRWGAQGNVDAGVTGLALLAFLGHGETPRDGKYRLNVHRALEWLESAQRQNGSFPGRFYTQGICTMATSEAYGLTRDPRWKKVAQKAVTFCVENQNPMGGWDYGGNNPERVDTSVTGWVVMGIKSGIASGLDVPQEGIDKIHKWLEWTTNAQGLTGYAGKPGEPTGAKPSMTAVASLCRQFMGWEADHPDMTRALAYLNKHGVDLKNMYYTYYGTLAMFQSGGDFWEKWNKDFRDPLIDKQIRDQGPEFNGSWEPDIAYGKQGGRVYSTAMSIFCLEVYYRFLPVMKH